MMKKVQSIQQHIPLPISERHLQVVSRTMPTEQPIKRHSILAVPVANGLKFITLADILYVQADGNYSEIVTQNNERFLVAKPLKSAEMRLQQDGFLRVHQSYLVNVVHIRQFGSQIELSSNEILPVSRRRSRQISQLIRSQYSI